MCPNLRLRDAMAVFAVLFLACGTAAAANWQPVATYQGERVEIDKARIARVGDGKTMAWNRLILGREESIPDSKEKYSTVQALNRYDCEKGSFATTKRVFMRDDKVVSQEAIDSPKEMAAAPGSVDERLLTEACKKRTIGDVQKVADAASKIASGAKPEAEKVAEAPPKAMFADMRSAGETKVPTTKKVESPSYIKLAETPVSSRRSRKTKPAPVVNELAHAHWSYEGEGAPANWSKLRPDFATCASGQRQSPININEGIRVDLEPIRFDYKPTMFRIINNGHTVQVGVGGGSSINVMGRRYNLQQIHFHRPSEERINGRGFDMVAHLVHKDYEDRYAVVAVLLESGAEHPLIQTFWNNLPLEVDQDLAPNLVVDLTRILPETRQYFSYMGSLTTPPCTEGVLWLVFKQPVQVSQDQIEIFSRLYRNNARPIQPNNSRLVKESR